MKNEEIAAEPMIESPLPSSTEVGKWPEEAREGRDILKIQSSFTNWIREILRDRLGLHERNTEFFKKFGKETGAIALEGASIENAILTYRQGKFKEELESSMTFNEADTVLIDNTRKERGDEAATKAEKQRKTERLRSFIFEENDITMFCSSELMEMFNKFKEWSAFEDMIRLYENCKNESFTSSPIVREFFAVALNKKKPPDPNTTITMCDALVHEGQGNGEIFGAMGKAHLLKGDIAQSFEAYKQGFLIDFEYYPGINACYRLLEMGNDEEAERLVKTVHLSCKQEGGIESNDYWCVITMLEAACIKRENAEEIRHLLDKVLSVATSDWQIDSTLKYLKPLSERRRAQNQPDANNIETVVRALETRLSDIQQKTLKPEELKSYAETVQDSFQEKDPQYKAWKDGSYNYRGLSSNFVGGNFNRKGQLYDHALNRTDLKNFDLILKTPLRNLVDLESLSERGQQVLARAPETLADITDVDEFLTIVDVLVRSCLRTDILNLENLHGKGHDIYDRSVKSMIEVSGCGVTPEERVGKDSRTNISINLALGLGDCRHHAQAKQLLFDRWQKQRVNELLREEHLEEAENLQRTELRTFDVLVRAPIQMKEKYKPVLFNGLPVLDQSGNLNDVEDHTLTILIVRDATGKVARVRFADSFYQTEYDWADGAISPADILSEKGIYGKTRKAWDPSTNSIVETPVYLKPLGYAGKRDRPSSDEHGQTQLLGKRVDQFSITEALGPEGRRNRDVFLNNLLDRQPLSGAT